MFIYIYPTQLQLLTSLKERTFENIVGKVENAGKQHFIFPRFLPYHSQKSSFELHSFFSSANASNCSSQKFCRLVLVKSLPSDKMSYMTKLRDSTDDLLREVRTAEFVSKRVYNIV